MAGSLPTVRGSQALYPVVRTVQFMTDISINLNASEQRVRMRPALHRFKLSYRDVNATETANFKSFYDTQKGTFDSTWDFTLDSTTYSSMAFEDSDFKVTESPSWPLLYDFELNARQTQNRGVTTAAQASAFPALANGLRAQLPYIQTRRFAVARNDNPMGPRYAWNWFDGVSPFPSSALMGWELHYPVLSDADLATLEGFFRNQWGRWGQFSFTDPDDTSTKTHVRFDDDALVINYLGPNQTSVVLKLLQTNN